VDDQGFYEGSGTVELGEHLRGPNRDRAPKAYKAHWGHTRTDVGKFRVFVNPLLAKAFPVLGEGGVYSGEKFVELPTAMQRPRASWQGMFFTQPPINLLELWRNTGHEATVTEGRLSTWSIRPVGTLPPESPGLRMRDLFHVLEKSGRSAWIEGRDDWEEWAGLHDLKRIVVEE